VTAADDAVFGDFDPDDAYDREPPDPEQVAAFRRRLARLRVPPDQLDQRVAAWLARQGAEP
jgi:hypothetical protein